MHHSEEEASAIHREIWEGNNCVEYLKAEDARLKNKNQIDVSLCTMSAIADSQLLMKQH